MDLQTSMLSKLIDLHSMPDTLKFYQEKMLAIIKSMKPAIHLLNESIV